MPTDTMIKSLSVRLTETELALAGKALAEALARVEALESDKKDFLDQWKEDTKEAEARVGELRIVCISGQEYRPIECRLVKDFARGVKELVRLDNDVVIESKPMTTEERQVSLPMDAKPKAAPVDPNAPPPLPGRACDGCGNVDGHRHPDCTVDRGEPEDEVEAAPEQAEIKPDGTLVHHLRLPAAVAPKVALGTGIDGNEYPLNQEQVDDVTAGRKVYADVAGDDSVVVEIVKLSKTPLVYEATDEDDEDLDAEELDAAPDSETDAIENDALAQVAEIAAEQLATGATPEVEADAKLEEAKVADKQRARGRGKPKGV